MHAARVVSGASCSTATPPPPPFRGQRVPRRARQAAAPSRATASAITLLPPLLENDADFCGTEGLAMTAPAPAPPPFSPHGNGKRYHIHTFGCQMNLADSERLAGALDAAGYARSPDAGAADVLVYNTCSIRQKAEDKLYGALGVHAARKRRLGADLTIVVAGCVAAQEGAALLRRVPEIDLVMGPHHVHRLPALLEQVSSGSQVVATEELDWAEDVSVPRRDSTLSAWVNLIHGCNERCTYCIVPTTRGREQSRTPAAIRAEMAALGEAGYREVTLLGQNVDAYGRDLPGSAPDGSGRRAHTLADLLRAVHDVPGIARIRFATSHPRYFSQRLVDACADLPKLCEFFHVPFQSGDDEVLRRMARGYTAARYRAIVDGIRRRMPDASISGDAIVGFPGETEEQFQGTLRLVEEVGFDRVNTAAFSPRPGTPAAAWDGQVADLIKSDRLQRLNAVVNRVAGQRAQRFLDRELEVLVEGPNPKDPGQAMGRSRHNKLVFFDGDGAALRGSLVMVHVHKVHAYSLFGELAGRPLAARM
ncbi:hypothetical protein ACKKBF_B09145 [Auxenochlorella protothecoides x Auxenochlorella symbiontica]